MPQFGILAPILGLGQNVPSILLEEAYHSDNLNVLLWDGAVERAQKPYKTLIDGSQDLVATPDGNPILEYHYYLRADGEKFLLAFTKANIYYWDGTNKEWDRKFVCGSTTGTDTDCEDWSVCTFNNLVIATNYVDKIIYWDGDIDTFRGLSEATKYSAGTVALDTGVSKTTLNGSGTAWDTDNNVAVGDVVYILDQTRAYSIAAIVSDTVLTITPAFDGTTFSGKTHIVHDNVGLEYGTGTYITKAKQVWNFENRLVLGYTHKAGSAYPSDIDWCAQSDHTEWKDSDSGGARLEGGDYIVGAGHYQDRLVIFKSESIHELWLVVSDLVFNASKIKENIGCHTPHSIVSGDNGELFFLASDKTIRVIRGMGSQFPIVSAPVWEDFWNIPDDYLSLVRAHWVRRYRHALWAIPTGITATANNYILGMDAHGRWCKADTPVTAFGRFGISAGWTIDTIPFPTIDEIGWQTIDDVKHLSGFLTEICGDSSGYTYDLYGSDKEDESTDYTSYFVLASTLSENKAEGVKFYKRCTSMTLIFRGEGGGTADITANLDSTGSWVKVGSGSVSLASSSEWNWIDLPCDLRFRHLQLKISTSYRFQFVGVIFTYALDGER